MASIDHFFVFTSLDAPEQQRLLDRGLQIGMRREHQGQGTRNACVGFADSYLELLWIANEDEARDPMVKPLGLYERMRWRDHRASPFGVCVRPDHAGETPPFAHWDYQPAYAGDDMAIRMGCNSGVIGEPLLFQIERPFQAFETPHLLSKHTLHQLTITTPALAPMSLLHELEVDRLELRAGAEHLMEVDLCEPCSAAGEQLDLRPELPIVLRW